MRSKYDNDFKRYVIENNIHMEVAKTKRDLYYKCFRKVIDTETGQLERECIDSEYSEYLLKCVCEPVLDCANRLNDSRYKKAQRVKKRITDLVLSNQAIFITLTFTDEVLENTNDKTRRRYVSRFLKDNCINYIANIDFGGQFGREHYHAVVDGSLNLQDWHKFGAIHCERIHTNEKDLNRVSKYIVKLTAHALKVNDKVPSLIYSRNKV